jgi:hypothetical protein
MGDSAILGLEKKNAAEKSAALNLMPRSGSFLSALKPSEGIENFFDDPTFRSVMLAVRRPWLRAADTAPPDGAVVDSDLDSQGFMLEIPRNRFQLCEGYMERPFARIVAGPTHRLDREHFMQFCKLCGRDADKLLDRESIVWHRKGSFFV